MANQEHVKTLKSGAEKWNKWREKNPEITPHLSEAHLSGAHLSGAHLSGADLMAADLRAAHLMAADLSEADLSEADLSEAYLRAADLMAADLRAANLSEAYLRAADLSKASLSEASLREANLREVNLREADLRAANLSGANLNGADLSGADLTNAIFASTVLASCNLSDIKGLDAIRHHRNSSIGMDTIAISKGKLPEKFLQGCGLSDLDIECAKLHIPHLTRDQVITIGYQIIHLRNDQPIQFYSSFISYSAQNVDFANKLHDDLQDKGVRCWFAPEDIQGGKKIRRQLDETIRIYDKLILILSEGSMNSKWVAHEIKQARKREVDKGTQMLFPIRLVEFNKIEKWELFDDDDVSNLAAEVRSYFIPDFSNWKDYSKYQEAFDRLLKDLRAEKEICSDDK